MKATDIIRENFSIWHEELAQTQELALCQARAMAPLLAKTHRTSGGGIGALREAVQDLLGAAKESTVCGVLQGALERLSFCEAFLAAHPSFADELMLSAEESHPRSAPLRVATMRATVFEHAKERLLPLLSGVETAYCNGFTELCEMLAQDAAALALLPIENTAEGILRRSYDLIERFELHVACTVEVATPDGNLTRVALLYHGTAPTLPPIKHENILECRTESTDGKTLTELLTVADACAMTLHRIDTLGGEDGELYEHLIFRTERNDLLFATYLALFIPRSVITAKYIHYN